MLALVEAGIDFPDEDIDAAELLLEGLVVYNPALRSSAPPCPSAYQQNIDLMGTIGGAPDLRNVTVRGCWLFHTGTGGDWLIYSKINCENIIYKDNISLALGGALERGKYYDTDAQEVRDDDYWAVNGMLDWKCTQHMSLGLGYMYSENTSSDQDFTIDRSEVMIRANANY